MFSFDTLLTLVCNETYTKAIWFLNDIPNHRTNWMHESIESQNLLSDVAVFWIYHMLCFTAACDRKTLRKSSRMLLLHTDWCFAVCVFEFLLTSYFYQGLDFIRQQLIRFEAHKFHDKYSTKRCKFKTKSHIFKTHWKTNQFNIIHSSRFTHGLAYFSYFLWFAKIVHIAYSITMPHLRWKKRHWLDCSLYIFFEQIWLCFRFSLSMEYKCMLSNSVQSLEQSEINKKPIH